MARELGVNVRVAKRAGLLHDIGKAVDREMEGTHLDHRPRPAAQVRRVAKRSSTPWSATTATSTRAPSRPSSSPPPTRCRRPGPGARREILESYLKRLEKLEEIADDFKGVQKAFAIQAGRELRIIVESERISDEEAVWLSRDVAKKIEAELTYPGQIKVTVIRETRAVEYAR